jgi:transaldolase
MAAAQLTAQGIRVSITAVYNLRQALLAENVGASSVAVYLRRMHEAGIDGLAQLGHMQRMLGIQRSSVELMGASIREPVEIVEKLAMLGIKSATLAASVLDDLLHSPATAEAARTFREDGDFIINQSAEVGAH